MLRLLTKSSTGRHIVAACIIRLFSGTDIIIFRLPEPKNGPNPLAEQQERHYTTNSGPPTDFFYVSRQREN